MTSDIFKNIEEAGDKDKETTKIDLGPISKLVDEQGMLEAGENPPKVELLYRQINKFSASIKDIEALLAKRKKDLFNVRQIQIPELMKEYGLDSLTTTSGTSIQIKDGLSVTVKNKDKLHKYLRANNAGSLIKDNIIIVLENTDKGKEVIKLCEENNLLYERKEAVHAMTLKKHVKDELKKGTKLPDNVLNIYEYEYSKIKK